MRKIIESDDIPSPPAWKSVQVTLSELPNHPQTVYYRDPHKVVDYIFGNPSFADTMEYVPRQVFEADGKTRLYHEFTTGDAWEKAQVSVGCCLRVNDRTV